MAPVSPPAVEPIEPTAVERTLNLSGVHDIGDALTAASVSPHEAQAVGTAAVTILRQPGEIQIVLRLLPAGTLWTVDRLQVFYPDGSGGVIERNSAGSLTGWAVAAELTKQVKVLRGELDTESFYSSAVAAGVLDTLIPEFINAFAYDFNLASEVAPGDTVEVAWQRSVNSRGEPVGPPQLLFASLTTPAKSRALYRFVSRSGQSGWYDGNGAYTKRGLMRTPVDGARITSKFGIRFHPVLHYNKMHRGVDFAAPTGTPIYAAADGLIEWAATKGANGNLTILKHDTGWETYYLHQSRFAAGVSAGVRVKQGQHIGDIGTTGRSTGPHLHYEVHIGGQPVDPLTVPSAETERKLLSGALLQEFVKMRDRIDVARAQQAL